MSGSKEGHTTVSWRWGSPEQIPAPIIRDAPYLELKLEHPDLEATAYSGQFYPSAVPYEIDGTHRVFYWRHSVAPSLPDPSDWQFACTTTHELTGFDTIPAPGPRLTTDDKTGTTVIVEGTVAGDAATTRVSSYTPPTVRLGSDSGSAITVNGDGMEYRVSVGDRRRIHLPQQRVKPLDSPEDAVSVTPVLAVRYPGRREIHHPAVNATYRLFPSFGIELSDIPNPVSIPTAGGELDSEQLADRLAVELSERPYAARVLWQAFAYTAFDPHADTTPQLTQLSQGHLVLQTVRNVGTEAR